MNTDALPPRRLPKVKFRVLIAGRANAGKTSILQRVCDITNSPDTYRVAVVDGEETRTKRGQHEITDELVFSNHKGYIFHDTRGFESGSTDELQTVQEFVRDRSGRKRLQDRLHAIWYCIPMDNQRPILDVAPFHNICPDKNVPVIAVFTKFEAFRSNTRLNLEDEEREYEDLEDQTRRECEKVFQAEYLNRLGTILFAGMEKPDARCDDLVESTVDALNPEAVTLMLLAVQTQNLELSVQHAVYCTSEQLTSGKTATKHIVKQCLMGFPQLWLLADRPRSQPVQDVSPVCRAPAGPRSRPIQFVSPVCRAPAASR
ncbi:hypothetical protein C8R44DRAFT_798372 [Mycena epipterygia]|nr:hypothetical protein C8R44DRAFT_798372 [Mycena epipterygia]